MGNSSGVIIPKPMLAKAGIKAGDTIELQAEPGRIVIAPVKGGPRAGWAEDSIRLARAGDDALVWPEFATGNDAALTW